jgi:hypothetical protein
MTRTAHRRYVDQTIVIPPPDRESLVMGVDKPDATNTGVLPNVSRTTSTGNITLGTNGVLQNRNVLGRVIITGANVIVRNCRISGGASNPGPLIECYSGSVSNAQIIDCDIGMLDNSNAHWNWNGPTGHGFTLLRCNIHHTTDGVGIFKTSANGGGAGVTYNAGVTVKQCWIHDLAWWTAATGGVVHSDTETHSDGIQIQGGTHVQILGNTIDAYLAKQYAHWWTVGQSLTEPYNFIAAQSLPTPAPYYGGPYQGGRAYLFPDRGTGTFATGRYNVGQLAALMINNNVGRVHSLTVTDNWINGGKAAINGGLVRASGENLGTFHRNKFDRGQGLDNGTPGGNSTYTVLISSSWAPSFVDGGQGTGNKNYYLDNGTEVNFRITG